MFTIFKKKNNRVFERVVKKLNRNSSKDNPAAYLLVYRDGDGNMNLNVSNLTLSELSYSYFMLVKKYPELSRYLNTLIGIKEMRGND